MIKAIVAQCVRRHSLLDRRPIGSGMNGAIELPRRQRHSESMSDTFSATTSETRNPAP
jgi:hypothetical protein